MTDSNTEIQNKLSKIGLLYSGKIYAPQTLLSPEVKDKIFMYIFMPFLGTKKIKNIHRKKMHHIEKHKNVQDCNYEEAIIDWECARFTKPDKPETARQVTERKFYQQPKHYTHLILMLNIEIKNIHTK